MRTIAELIEELKKLPQDAKISYDFGLDFDIEEREEDGKIEYTIT